MVDMSTLPWDALERWSPRLYLFAGAVLAVYAALNGLVAFTDMSLELRVFQAAYVAGFLGLLGLYPALRDRSPSLAGIGAVGAALGAIAFTIFAANNLATLSGVVPGGLPGMGPLTLVGVVVFLVGYGATGVACLRTDAYSRTVGLLLLVPAIIIALMVGTIVSGLVSDGTVFVVSAGQAMTHLAIGTTLDVETDDPVERTDPESAPETTAKG